MLLGEVYFLMKDGDSSALSRVVGRVSWSLKVWVVKGLIFSSEALVCLEVRSLLTDDVSVI